MNTCPYCGTGVAADQKGSYYCGFCNMKGFVPGEDGSRNERWKEKEFISNDDFNKTTPELMTYNTFNLLQLLKLLREERRSFFKHIAVFKKAGQETNEFKEIEVETGNEYENITRKTWVVENILRDRIGYVPERVTDQLLITVAKRMDQERNKKPMMIKKNSPELKQGISR